MGYSRHHVVVKALSHNIPKSFQYLFLLEVTEGRLRLRHRSFDSYRILTIVFRHRYVVGDALILVVTSCLHDSLAEHTHEIITL